MSRKKKSQKTLKTQKTSSLDLHDEKHADVDRLVENFIFLTPVPHDIITGNSSEMQDIVKDVLERNDFKYVVGDINNKGYIRVIGH